MAHLFRPKHQKLVLQCYPPGNAALGEMLPNAAELSQLLFYASTRRTKLDKVGTFLVRKTETDVSRKRMGHVAVTLHILGQLLDHCREDVGVLSGYVLSILQNVMQLNELSSYQSCLSVFETYCKVVSNAQNSTFGDHRILEGFKKMSFQFCQCNGTENRDQLDWVQIPIKASKCLSDYINPAVLAHYTSSKNKSLISQCILILLHSVRNSNEDLSLVKLVSNSASTLNGDSKKGPLNALDVLISFFNTSSRTQSDSVTTSFATYVLALGFDLRYSCDLMTILMKKSHIELRSRMIGAFFLLIDNKGSPDLKLDIKNNKSHKVYLASIVSHLLANDMIQFFAMPVSGIYQEICDLETRLVKEGQVEDINDDELLLKYTQIINNLSHRIYYNDQMSDLFIIICDSYCSFISRDDGTRHNLSQIIQMTDIVIGHLNDAMSISQESSIKVKINDIRYDIFKKVHSSLERVFDDEEQIDKSIYIKQVEVKWLALFSDFNSQFKRDSWKQIQHKSSLEQTRSHYFENVNQILIYSKDPEDRKSVCASLLSFLDCVGDNFLITWWSRFAKAWLEDEPETCRFICENSQHEELVSLAQHPNVTYDELTETLSGIIPNFEQLLSTNGTAATPASNFDDSIVPPPRMVNLFSAANSVRSFVVPTMTFSATPSIRSVRGVQTTQRMGSGSIFEGLGNSRGSITGGSVRSETTSRMTELRHLQRNHASSPALLVPQSQLQLPNGTSGAAGATSGLAFALGAVDIDEDDTL